MMVRHGQCSYVRVDRTLVPVPCELDGTQAEMAEMGKRLDGVERWLGEL